MEEKQTFEEAVKPLIKWLSENKNPHTYIFVTSTGAEMVEGVKVLNTDEFLID